MTLRMWLEGSNGDRIDIGDVSGPVRRLPGIRGFGIPPKVLGFVEGAGDGAFPRYTRTGPREVDLPLILLGLSSAEVRSLQTRIASALRPRGAVTAWLVVEPDDGIQYRLGVYYAAGAETSIGSEAGVDWCRWVLTLRCPDPFWAERNARQVTVTAGNSGRGLLPRLSRLQISSSQIFGSVIVENPGDVDSFVDWSIRGPASSFTAELNGEGFELGAIDAGETITISTSQAGVSVVDQTGANRYAMLSAAPRFFRLPGGRSTVSMLLGDATEDSLVAMLYRPRYEVMF